MSAPDITGLLLALARVRPELKPVLRAARSAHTAASALHVGRRYRTRALPRRRTGACHWRDQPRDAAGRWTTT